MPHPNRALARPGRSGRAVPVSQDRVVAHTAADRDGAESSVAAGALALAFSEDSLGFIRPRGDAAHHVARVLDQDGKLLAEAARTTPELEVPLVAGGLPTVRVERLLRYYFGSGGRRVVLVDGLGSRWSGRIIGTRWHPTGRVWSISSVSETAAA